MKVDVTPGIITGQYTPGNRPGYTVVTKPEPLMSPLLTRQELVSILDDSARGASYTLLVIAGLFLLGILLDVYTPTSTKVDKRIHAPSTTNLVMYTSPKFTTRPVFLPEAKEE